MLTPLPSLLRPSSFDDMVGHEKLIGREGVIRKFVRSSRIPSMIFWGGPGTGKTTLAYVISKESDGDFFHLSGVVSKKEDIMKIITKARSNFANNKPTIVFLDEIHRWNKAQQDTLLPFVEKGIVSLIGATTENPSFTINNALLSRCRVFRLDALGSEDIVVFIEKNREKIAEQYRDVTYMRETLDIIARSSGGDIRSALLTLEAAIIHRGVGDVLREDIEAVGTKLLQYDRDGEEHYNIISAFHKSMRDSDPDGAIYWLSRMLAGGEDPRYIARRMLNFASEDVGLSDPQALILANTVYDVCEKMGMPECELPLCEVATYLSFAPRDNRLYTAMKRAHEDIRIHGDLPVPMHIRNAPTKFMKDAGYGAGYEYAHDLETKKSSQTHRPPEIEEKVYFEK